MKQAAACWENTFYELFFYWTQLVSLSSLLSDAAEEKEETDDEESDDEEEEDEEDDTEVKEENGVSVLTDGNFETFMEGKDTVLVEFYAPWYTCFLPSCLPHLCYSYSYFPYPLASLSVILSLSSSGVATANSLPPNMKRSLRP